jgi:hypothetical protein
MKETGKSIEQIKKRIDLVNRGGKKSGSFTQSEDNLILRLVRKFGNDYRSMSKLMPSRTSAQIRERYVK